MTETPLRSITNSGTWMPILAPTYSMKIFIARTVMATYVIPFVHRAYFHHWTPGHEGFAMGSVGGCIVIAIGLDLGRHEAVGHVITAAGAFVVRGREDINQIGVIASVEVGDETATEGHCGRPLGLRFHLKSGYLYVADAYKGLMRVAPGGGEATVLVTEVDGVPLRFTNGVDIDQADITYPNGLAISADRTHLIISSTGPCKLLRYWIKGSKACTVELFADLPGYPDNVRPDKRGGYWVALHREKAELPFGVDSHLLALRIDVEEKIIEEMRGPKSVRPTEVLERKGGRLFMGSVELTYVAVVKRT
uniref:Strictosidine synthase 1 n=1 Tax=Aegilops tauschii TaxID=37682 RepID=M8C0R2_AEGTA